MSLESRVAKLETATGISDWDTLRPEDTSPETWEEIGDLLRSLPDDHDHFYPHTDFSNMVADIACGTRPHARLLDCPDAVLQASIQLECDRLGHPYPTWLWRVDKASDEELRADVDGHQDQDQGATAGAVCSGNCSACEPAPANTGK